MGALVLAFKEDELGFKTAMEYATEIINNRSDILKDYELVVRYAKTLVGIENEKIGMQKVKQLPVLRGKQGRG